MLLFKDQIGSYCIWYCLGFKSSSFIIFYDIMKLTYLACKWNRTSQTQSNFRDSIALSVCLECKFKRNESSVFKHYYFRNF